ncbi:MAG TPA: thioredoxin domain-containing protein, partial [Terriglobia bacterium]|nr:thioredoxin domain-containing protein [Terriglobia bacterium]
ENEFREVLRHCEPPEGFAERVVSRAGHLTASAKPAVRVKSRLVSSLTVIGIAVALAGAAGLVITNCASACSIGGTTAKVAGSPVHVALSAGGGHALGPEQGQITLEEYGDYQCPACSAYFPIVEELLRGHPNQLRFEYHHFPLTGIHRNAMGAAIAAEAAGEQNHFWDMHRILYQRQKEWGGSADTEAQFAAYAAEIGLDVNQFRQSLQSPVTQQRVEADLTRAQDAKFSGTPTFLINGKVIELSGSPEEFSALIRAQLDSK